MADQEHFSAEWIRFAAKKCGKPKNSDDFTSMKTALGTARRL